MKHLFFLLLLTTSTAFSQDKPEKLYMWPDGKWSVLDPGPPVTYPDTLRAILLVTLGYRQQGIAHARMGYVVRQPGKPPVYLDCRKRALRGSQVGWDYRIVNSNDQIK